MVQHLPTQLTSLSLGMFKFTRKYRLGNRPQILPTLTFLSLCDVSFQGAVRDYLRCPKLEELSYHDFAAELQLVEEGAELDEDFARVLFDEPFFRGVPELKSITFRGLIVDGVLVNILEGCSLLHTLELEDCLMLGFIPSFSKSINHKACFPSLKTIKLETLWPEDAKVSYRGFVDECRVKRPQMWFSGNAKSPLPSLLEVPITPYSQVDGNSSDSTSFQTDSDDD
ncbi:hypothetical protein CPB86DRAFT_195742 [Serendipita vermifera]|nr:hypothetical protein CPB86DRAFT_195742 [Serendipita vermifera]